MKDNSQLLVKAAQLYYDTGVNQSDIATILGVSRPTVSRLLDKAREEGIVEIIVHDPIDKDQDLSNRLRDAFGLRDAVVITGNYDYEKALERCCEAAIQFLDQILQDGDSIGVAWGSVPQIICRTMKPRDFTDITVVQMVGSLGTGDTDVDGTRIAMRLAHILGGTYCNIYSPIYVHNREVCEYLSQEPAIAATLERAMHTDVIITGIGSLDSKTTIQRAGYWQDSDMNELRNLGAVGHLLGRPYDKNGEPIERDGHYIVGAPLSSMRNAGWSVGVIAADIKAEATLGAIKGGYVNALIADQHAAKKMLSLKDSL